MVELEGSCLCGAIKIKSSGPILNKALCHCLDCRKITSSTNSTNVVVPQDSFSVTQGTPKEFSKAGDSGSIVTRFFCGDCGSSLWSQSTTYGETKVIKAGILDTDGALEAEGKPLLELYVRSRLSWREAVEGAVQYDGHP